MAVEEAPQARPRLVLFDIDGTLLDTAGAGGAALLDAVEECFAVPRSVLPPLNLAGATDLGVVRELFQQLAANLSDASVANYLACYLRHLKLRLGGETFAGKLLPGIVELLVALAQSHRIHLGLLTGNVRQGAHLKLSRFGIHEHFGEGAFGDDHEDRNQLAAVAKRRMEKLTGLTFDSQDVIVIGDTPKDIACARAIGARCLAVATGIYSADELRGHSPWRCVDSLAETRQICEWLLS